jgi:hypothetical protein
MTIQFYHYINGVFTVDKVLFTMEHGCSKMLRFIPRNHRRAVVLLRQGGFDEWSRNPIKKETITGMFSSLAPINWWFPIHNTWGGDICWDRAALGFEWDIYSIFFWFGGWLGKKCRKTYQGFNHSKWYIYILYYIILYFTILYYTILYYIILYYIILCYVILYYIILLWCYFILYYILFLWYYIILYYILLCYVILYYSIYYIILYVIIFYYIILYYIILCYVIVYYSIYYFILCYNIVYYSIYYIILYYIILNYIFVILY